MSDLEYRLSRLAWMPRTTRLRVLTWMIGRTVPFVRAGRLRLVRLDGNGIELELPKRAGVQNHIGTIHAAAAVLLAETAGGLAFAFVLPSGRVPVVKSLTMDYRRKFHGSLRASASVDPQDAERMKRNERGDCMIDIHLADESGPDPALCRFIYAWHPPRVEVA